MAQLDEMLRSLLAEIPDWQLALSSEEVRLITLRLRGATLEDLGDEFGLTRAGVRSRLYGEGRGGVRRGGLLGRLRGLKRQHKPTQGCQENAKN